MPIGRKRKNAAANAQQPASPNPASSNPPETGETDGGQAPATCPSCGAALAPDARFCNVCGTNVVVARRHAEAAKKKGKKSLEKEIKRVAGEQAATCTNDLAGFRMMFENGIAESTEGVFSRSMLFDDISYENERKDVRDDIFDKFCQVHASFPPGSCYQINLLNIPHQRRDAERYLPEIGANADWARPYNDILEERQRKGRVEFDRPNVITFSTTAADDEEAERILSSTVNGLENAFSRLHSNTSVLDGMGRMRILHDILRGPGEPFVFDYGKLMKRKSSRARDFVAPSWAAYAEEDKARKAAITMPGRYVKVFHIRDFGSDLSDRALRTIRALPIPMNISLLFRPQPRGKTVERIRQNVNVVQASMNDYAQSIAKSGGDPTRLPPVMEEREADAIALLDHVRDDDQLISWFQGLITVFAESPERMKIYERMLMDEKGTWTIDIVEMPLQQEPALVSSLPLATPRLENKYRSLSTAESAAMIPFSSQNIHDDPKTSLLFGVDAVSGDAILVDPDKTKSPHGWIFGQTGAGKGMQVNAFLTYAILQHPRTDFNEKTHLMECPEPRCPQWHVVDFHAEYIEVGRKFDAPVSSFGPGHEACLNPMGISAADGKLTMRAVVSNIDFFLALCASTMGRPITQAEKSVLDRCLRITYTPHIGKMSRPTLKDLYRALREDESPLAFELADAWEIFVEGSLSTFAAETNIRTDKQLNVYDFSEVGEQMTTLALLSVLQHVRTCTFQNYRTGKPTYLIFEEVQSIFDNDAAVAVLDSYFGELRKYGLHIICVTQLPTRVLDHPAAANLFKNSGYFVFLPMSGVDADRVANMFSLSDSQHERIMPRAKAGTGLVIADDVKVAMNNRIPTDNVLYQTWNTDPYKLANLSEKEKAALE